MKKTALFLACCMLFEMTGSEFSPGGVSFPMEQISAERFGVKNSNSPNLLKEDLTLWRSGIWIFGPKANKDKTPASREITSRKIVKVDGKEALELNRPAALQDLMLDQTPEFTTSFSQTIKLPDLEGGNYKFSFESRNKVVGKMRFAHYVLYTFYDNSDPRPGRGKSTRGSIVNPINSNPQWSPYSYEFSVPPKTRDLHIALRGDGCGLFQARSLRLEKLAKKSALVSVELSPMKLLDNTYVLASDTLGTMGFRFKTNLPKGKLPWGHGYRFSIEFPESVKVLEGNSLFKKTIEQESFLFEGKNYVRYTLDCSPIINLVRNGSDFNGWNIPCLLLKGKGAPGTQFKCFYFVSDKGKVISDKGCFTLKFMEPLAPAAAPKQFLTGFSSVSNDVHFGEHGEELGKFFAGCGVNIAVGSWNKEFSDKVRKGGIPLLTAECYAIANAFRIGIVPENQRPADSIYRDAEGKPVIRHGSVSTCPYAVYSKGEYYTKHVVPLMKKITASGIDGLQPNWEPWWWRSRGCFCDNCRSEFAKFAKMPLEQVKKMWPKDFMTGEKMHAKAVEFRGWQHGKLIEVLNELTLAHGAKMGFFPEVGTDQIIRSADYQVSQGEFSPYNYADKLQWLNVWGPYVWFMANQPYAYSKGAHLRFYLQSIKVFHDYGATFPDKAKRAKLMAMPHGSQCDMCALGQPEGLAMDQLSAFLTGYSASVLYFFPRSYDHRYWKAFAECNAAIARTEEFVMNGKVRKDLSVKPLTPFAAPAQFAISYFKGAGELLQVIGFEKNGKILAAVGNFWEKGDVVFTLKVPGLNAKKRYTVAEKAYNRRFVSDKGSFTGRELAAGIKLHAGSLRWAFFEIAPEYRNSGEAVTASQMNALEKTVAARTAKAAKAEAERDKMLHAEQDKGELKDCSFGALKCKAVNDRLKIVSGANCAVIDPKGMSLPVWRVNGAEQGLDALAGFWTPGRNGCQCNGIFRITEEKADANGLSVTGTMTTTVRSYPQLPGVVITKTYRFSPDLKKLEITAELKNPSEVDKSGVGFRWSLFPAAWNNRTAGKITVGNQSFPRFRRQTLLVNSINPAGEETLRRLFAVKSPTVRISGNTFVFEDRTGNQCRCTMEPARLFGGVAVWDSADMAGATFEPFYQALDIGPGEKAVFRLKFEY